MWNALKITLLIIVYLAGYAMVVEKSNCITYFGSRNEDYLNLHGM